MDCCTIYLRSLWRRESRGFSAEPLVKFCYCLDYEQEGVFTNLRRLARLSLTNNFISALEPQVFDEWSNLTSLYLIHLTDNQITQLEPWPLKLAQHEYMIVSFHRNKITNFTNAVRWSFDCNSTFVGITLALNYNDIKHITDVIHGWNIDGELSCVTLCTFFRLNRTY